MAIYYEDPEILVANSLYFPQKFPFSLQQMCMLYVLMRLEQFPVKMIALLPLDIRRRLVTGLPPVDVLRLRMTDVFAGVNVRDTTKLVDYAGKEMVRWCVGDHNASFSRSCIFSIQLHCTHDHKYSERVSFFKYVCPDLKDHIVASYQYLKPHTSEYILVPDRFKHFAGARDHVTPVIMAVIDYCGGHRLPPGVRCRLACNTVAAGSPIWTQFMENLESMKGSTKPCDLQVPAIKKVMSMVNQVTFIDDKSRFSKDHEALYLVPYVFLYNASLCKEPYMKRVIIESTGTAVIDQLESIVDLLLPQKRVHRLLGKKPPVYQKILSDTYQLKAPSVPKRPYRIEEISLLNTDFSYIEPEASERACILTKAIIDYQIHTLQRVEFDRQGGKGSSTDYVPGYKKLLSSVVELIKQPQMRCVRISKPTINEAYAMVKAFLLTPTTHEQWLEIGAFDYENYKLRTSFAYIMAQRNKTESDEEPEPPPPQEPKRKKKPPSLPPSNGDYKHLCMLIAEYNSYLVDSTRKVYKFLFQEFCVELRLKELIMTVFQINSLPLDFNLQVERLILFGEQSRNDLQDILQPQLSKFVVENVALKEMVLVGECANLVVPLTECFVQLTQIGRGPEVIYIKSLVLDLIPYEIKKEFFFALRDVSQRCGTYLLMQVFPQEYLQTTLKTIRGPEFYKVLGMEFNGNKMPKIAYNLHCALDEHEHPMSYMPLLADEVVEIDQDDMIITNLAG